MLESVELLRYYDNGSFSHLLWVLSTFFTGGSQWLYYAMLKLGKSREETHESFRNVLTDIERLLVMRDDPPNPPKSYRRGLSRKPPEQRTNEPSVLGPDDLGMLMLLIHELRSILWSDRGRFSVETTRSVLEDLAELAGERGKCDELRGYCIL